jgi:phage protein D
MNYTLAQINAMEKDGRITPLMAASARLRLTVARLTDAADDIHAGIERQREQDAQMLKRMAEHGDATNRVGRQ